MIPVGNVMRLSNPVPFVAGTLERSATFRKGDHVVVLTEPGYFEHVIVLFPDGTLLATNMMNFAKKKGLFERVE